MINFAKKYNRNEFQIFLKNFLPNDYKQISKELLIEKSNKYFKRATLLGNVTVSIS